MSGMVFYLQIPLGGVHFKFKKGNTKHTELDTKHGIWHKTNTQQNIKKIYRPDSKLHIVGYLV